MEKFIYWSLSLRKWEIPQLRWEESSFFYIFTLFRAEKKLPERHNVPRCGVISESTLSDTGLSAHLGGGSVHCTQVKIHWRARPSLHLSQGQNSLTHDSKTPLSCQWSSRDRSNHELPSGWMRLYTFLFIGKICQNYGKGKQKRAIAVRTIPDSTYERVLWSSLMISSWHLSSFFLHRERYVIPAGNCTNHGLCFNTFPWKTLSKENLEKVAITGTSLYIIGFFFFFFIAR